MTDVLRPRKFQQVFPNIFRLRLEDGQRTTVFIGEPGCGKQSIVMQALVESRSVIGRLYNCRPLLIWITPRRNLIRQGLKFLSPTEPLWPILTGRDANAVSQYKIDGITTSDDLDEETVISELDVLILSYQILSTPFVERLAEIMSRRWTILITDEHQLLPRYREERAHELGDAAGWVKHIGELLKYARHHIAMLGDLRRANPSELIAFVPYESDNGTEVYVDFSVRYQLSDMLEERACINPDFLYYDVMAELERHPADDPTDVEPYAGLLSEAPKRFVPAGLNKYLSGASVTEMLRHFVENLTHHRLRTGPLPHQEADRPRMIRRYEKAKGMIVCKSIEHAHSIQARILEMYPDLREHIDIIYSLQSDADTRLERFKTSRHTFICIAVAIPYIGFDCPELSHLAVLTNYRSVPWLRQLLARVWRVNRDQPQRHQYVCVYAPRDPLFIDAIAEIWAQRKEVPLGDDHIPPPNDGNAYVIDGQVENVGKENVIEFPNPLPGWLTAIDEELPPEDTKESEMEIYIRKSEAFWHQERFPEAVIQRFRSRLLEEIHAPIIDGRSYSERCEGIRREIETLGRRYARQLAALHGAVPVLANGDPDERARVPRCFYAAINGAIKKLAHAKRSDYGRNEGILQVILGRMPLEIGERLNRVFWAHTQKCGCLSQERSA